MHGPMPVLMQAQAGFQRLGLSFFLLLQPENRANHHIDILIMKATILDRIFHSHLIPDDIFRSFTPTSSLDNNMTTTTLKYTWFRRKTVLLRCTPFC